MPANHKLDPLSSPAYLKSLLKSSSKDNVSRTNAPVRYASRRQVKEPLRMKYKRNTQSVFIPDYGFLNVSDLKNRNVDDVYRDIKGKQLVSELIKEQQNPGIKLGTSTALGREGLPLQTLDYFA